MQKKIKITMFALALTVAVASSVEAQQWAIRADYTESCSCNPACPCLFGSTPTLGHCEGTGLVQIKEGHYGDISLDGISVVFTVHLGEWMKYYVSEEATDEQAKATEQLVASVFEIPGEWEVLSTEKVPVSLERTETKVKFSVPASTVEIEIMKGRDGSPIKIENLPPVFAQDYTQYKSITNSHKSEDKEFSYSGTNGFTSKIEATSEK